MGSWSLSLNASFSLYLQGQKTPIVKNVFTLDTCAPISGAEVHSFEDERAMLQAWRDFVVASDPDIITGYNIVGFDIPYLVDRARALKCDAFPLLGRIAANRTRIKKQKVSSAQMGTRETNEITIEGRVIFDVLQVPPPPVHPAPTPRPPLRDQARVATRGGGRVQ